MFIHLNLYLSHFVEPHDGWKLSQENEELKEELQKLAAKVIIIIVRKWKLNGIVVRNIVNVNTIAGRRKVNIKILQREKVKLAVQKKVKLATKFIIAKESLKWVELSFEHREYFVISQLP